MIPAEPRAAASATTSRIGIDPVTVASVETCQVNAAGLLIDVCDPQMLAAAVAFGEEASKKRLAGPSPFNRSDSAC